MLSFRAHAPVIVIGLLVTTVFAKPAPAAELLVPAQYATIQAAIDAATNGDTITVAPGTYAERIRYRGKEIAVRSSDGRDATTIDGGGAGSVVRFFDGEGPGAVLEGFEITGGTGTNRAGRTYGGGLVGRNASPTIRDCRITGNRSQSGAGGAFGGGSPQFENTEFVMNDALCTNSPSAFGYGAGLAFYGGSPTIHDCLFETNRLIYTDMEEARGFGGGIYGDGVDSILVTDSAFLGNGTQIASAHGGGMRFESSGDIMVLDCDIRGNSVCRGGGGISVNECTSLFVRGSNLSGHFADCFKVGSGGGLFIASTPSRIENCLLIGNDAAGGGGATGGDEYVGCVFARNSAITGAGLWTTGTITNCTVVFNDLHVPGSSAGITGDSVIVNSLVRWNIDHNGNPSDISGSPTITYSNVSGGWPGIGNIDEDVTLTERYQMILGSAGIDAGDDAAPGLPATDRDGNPRILDGDGDAIARIDIGADEVARTEAVLFGNYALQFAGVYPQTEDLLFVNGASGDAARRVTVADGAALQIEIDRPAAASNGRFVLHANLTAPTDATLTQLPFSIGPIGFPLVLPQATPVAVWNNIGKTSVVGESSYFGSPIGDSAPAPTTVLDLPTGDPANLPPGTVLTVQGLIHYENAPSPKNVVVTNGVVVEIL